MIVLLSDLDQTEFRRSLVFDQRTVALHAMISAAGIEHRNWPDQYRWDGQSRGQRPFVLLQITLAGCGQLRYEGYDMPVPAGTAMLLHFPHEHVYSLPRHGRWQFFYICLHGREVLRLCRIAQKTLGPTFAIAPTDRLFRETQSACEKLRDQEIQTPFAASQTAYAVTMALMEHAKQSTTGAQTQNPDTIQRAVTFAKEHYHRPIGVEDLANQAGLSRCHFTRLFTTATGLPPGEFLIQQRLKAAVTLLQTTDRNLEDIARSAGFADANHLGKRFRTVYGTSPGSLRKSAMYGTAGG